MTTSQAIGAVLLIPCVWFFFFPPKVPDDWKPSPLGMGLAGTRHTLIIIGSATSSVIGLMLLTGEVRLP